MNSMSRPTLTLLVAFASVFATPCLGQNSSDTATPKVELQDGNSIENGHTEPAGLDGTTRKVVLKNGKCPVALI